MNLQKLIERYEISLNEMNPELQTDPEVLLANLLEDLKKHTKEIETKNTDGS